MRKSPKIPIRTTSGLAAVRTVVNEREAAKLTGYTVEGLRSRRYAGLAPAWYKTGHFVRYSPKEIREWITSSRQKVAL